MFAMRGMADKPPKPQDIATDPSGVFNSAREELKNVGGDLAKTISGNVSREMPSVDPSDVAAVTRELGGSSKGAHGGLKEDFASITRDIAETVPQPVLRMGLAGGLPYVGTSLAALYYARQAGQAASGVAPGVDVESTMQLLSQIQHVQVTYGAVLLGFLGAIHWGMEFAKYGGEQGYKRLVLGVAPALYAWPTLALAPEMALAAQWAGFTAFWYADSKVTTAGWTPTWYSQYRFYLSVLVGTCIIGTLGGINLLGPESHSKVGAQPHAYAMHRAVTKGSMGGLATKGGRMEGTLSGDTEGIEAVRGEEDSDAYVIIKKMDKPESENDEGEESEQKKEANKGETNTKEPGKQEAQEKKDEAQKGGKAGQVRKGEKAKNSGDAQQGEDAKEKK